MTTEHQRQLDELDELERLEEEQADRDYIDQRAANRTARQMPVDDDPTRSCGCSDYHYADCPIRTGA
jgi:hypothetical protein